MKLRGIDMLDAGEEEGHDMDAFRPRRPYLLIAAALALAVLASVLWVKWAGSRDEALRLRAELKEVYAEAESLRTQSTSVLQKLVLLEQQVRKLNAERDEALQKLEAGGAKGKPKAKPAGNGAAKTRG